jgi:hypothetical protein
MRRFSTEQTCPAFLPEVDPEYLEHARHEALDEHDQPDLPWDA